MTINTEAPPNEPRRPKYWPGLAALVTAMTAIGGSVLFLVGSTVLQTYYSEWGIDSALFAASPQQTVVLGYYALVNEYAAGFLKVTGQYLLWIIAYALTLWFAAWASGEWAPQGKGALSKFASNRPGLARLLAMLLASLGVVVFMPLMIGALLLLLLASPLKADDDYGKDLAAHQLAEYKPGCDKPKGRSHCATLTRNDVPVARGFLVGAGEKVVAIFDPASNRIIVIERDGLQLSSQPRAPVP